MCLKMGKYRSQKALIFLKSYHFSTSQVLTVCLRSYSTFQIRIQRWKDKLHIFRNKKLCTSLFSLLFILLSCGQLWCLLFLSGKWDFKKVLHPADSASLEEVSVLLSKAEVENKTSIEWRSHSPSLWEYSM